MSKPKEMKRRRVSRLGRIESKCDRILSELIMLRQRLSSKSDEMDAVIDRMHSAAKRLRRQCESEYATCMRPFHKS